MSNKPLYFRWLSGLLVVLLTAGLLLTTCKKPGIVLPPSIEEFVNPPGAAYYITNDPNSVYQIPVGFSTVSSKERTIIYTVVSSTGSEGSQYNFGGSKGTVTVPADSTIGFIDVNGLFAGYSATPGRVDTLVLALSGGDAPPASFADTFTLTLQQYCPVVLNDLTGVYNTCYDIQGGAYGPYSVTISATSTGPTSAKLIISNLAAAAFGPFALNAPAVNPGITVNIDWSNPANFTTTLPTQAFYTDPTYGPATMQTGTGTFSSCNNNFTVNYSVTVSQGSFGGFTTTIAR